MPNVKNFAIIDGMQDSLKDTIAKWFTLVLVAGIVVVGLFLVWPVYLRGESLKRINADLDRKIAHKRQEIAKLKDNQQRFRTDADFVEHIARQNRRVFPGELVFVFESD